MPIINSVVETSSSEDEDEGFPIGKIRRASSDIKGSKKRFEIIPDSFDTLVVENDPVERLEGVIKSSDPAEWQKPIDVEKGATKNLASMFQNIGQSDSSSSKKPFKFDIDENAETIVVENEPVILEGVVRSVDKTEDVIGKRGRIKNLAGRFINPSKLSDDEEETPNVPKEKTVEIERGRTRMIQEKWQQQGMQPPPTNAKPREKVDLDAATEYGVYENEPEVRSDVVKGGVEQPDVIHVKHTRNLRKMWCQFEQQELAKERDSKNIESIVKAKKVEVQPEPEIQPPPPEETKPAQRKYGPRPTRKESDKVDNQKSQPPNNDSVPGFQKPTLRSVPRKRL